MPATKKFEALTHLIVHECRDNPTRLGSTRLNKALWFADMVAYKQTGKSITGDKYVKRQHGPVPKHILKTVDKLKAKGVMTVTEPQYAYEPRQYISLSEPDVSALSDEERRMAKAAVDIMCQWTATAISDDTHDIVWEAAMLGEEIPIEASLAANRGEVTKDVIKWANASIKEIAAT